MLKEVGASGQISLGKKFAGRLFDVVFYPDGRIEMVPMKAVPTVGQQPAFDYFAANLANPSWSRKMQRPTTWATAG